MQLGNERAVTLNAVGLYGISALLLTAFVWQFTLDELPCPLCLLQRVAFTALAVGPVLNIVGGPRPRNYALVIFAAAFGAAVAGRQVLLHIQPGDAGFGSAVLGLHLYTWAFIAFVAAILLSALMLLMSEPSAEPAGRRKIGWFAAGSVYAILALTVLNALSAFAQCGFAGCPGDPVRYELFG
jgi:disulfide bond formation protein DsbB